MYSQLYEFYSSNTLIDFDIFFCEMAKKKFHRKVTSHEFVTKFISIGLKTVIFPRLFHLLHNNEQTEI